MSKTTSNEALLHSQNAEKAERPISVNDMYHAYPPKQHLEIPSILRVPSPDGFLELSVNQDDIALEQNEEAGLPLAFAHQKTTSPPARGTLKSWLPAFFVNNKGPLFVALSQLFGALMNVTTRLLEMEGNNGKGMHPFQILFARMFITVVLASIYMYYAKTPDFPFGAKQIRLLLVARGLVGFFGVFGLYYSLQYLPLADATVITFLAPSISCWACSYILKEPFTRMEQVAAFVSLIGVVLIAHPASLFAALGAKTSASGDFDIVVPVAHNTSSPDQMEDLLQRQVTPKQRLMAVAFAMLGVFGAAAAYTTLRWIGKRAHPLISVNYFATWCTLVSVVMMFVLPDIGFLLPANLKEWGYLFSLGICGFIMQFLLAAGLSAEKSSRATNMVYTQMLFALAFDELIFSITPGLLSILGSSLILGSAIYVAVRKSSTKQTEDLKAEELAALDLSEGQGLLETVEEEDKARGFIESPELEAGRIDIEEQRL